MQNFEQEQHGHCSGDSDDDPYLLKKVISYDESWVFGYGIEIKAQSLQWKRPEELRSKKALQVRSVVKVLLTVFFDCNGVVHHEFLPQDCTFNKEYQRIGEKPIMDFALRTRSHIDAYAWVFGQKQNRNHASITVFTGLGLRWLFPLPKTEDLDESKAFCYE